MKMGRNVQWLAHTAKSTKAVNRWRDGCEKYSLKPTELLIMEYRT